MRISGPAWLCVVWLITCALGCVQEGDVDLFDRVSAAEDLDLPSEACADPVDFSSEVTPIFEANCAIGGCHLADHFTGLNLSPLVAFDNIAGVESGQSDKAYIEPGDEAESYLVDKILGAAGSTMPIGGELTDDEIESIVCWVQQGALASADDAGGDE